MRTIGRECLLILMFPMFSQTYTTCFRVRVVSGKRQRQRGRGWGIKEGKSKQGKKTVLHQRFLWTRPFRDRVGFIIKGRREVGVVVVVPDVLLHSKVESPKPKESSDQKCRDWRHLLFSLSWRTYHREGINGGRNKQVEVHSWTIHTTMVLVPLLLS